MKAGSDLLGITWQRFNELSAICSTWNNFACKRAPPTAVLYQVIPLRGSPGSLPSRVFSNHQAQIL
jgi:hypothetical protein